MLILSSIYEECVTCAFLVLLRKAWTSRHTTPRPCKISCGWQRDSWRSWRSTKTPERRRGLSSTARSSGWRRRYTWWPSHFNPKASGQRTASHFCWCVPSWLRPCRCHHRLRLSWACSRSCVRTASWGWRRWRSLCWRKSRSCSDSTYSLAGCTGRYWARSTNNITLYFSWLLGLINAYSSLAGIEGQGDKVTVCVFVCRFLVSWSIRSRYWRRRSSWERGFSCSASRQRGWWKTSKWSCTQPTRPGMTWPNKSRRPRWGLRLLAEFSSFSSKYQNYAACEWMVTPKLSIFGTFVHLNLSISKECGQFDQIFLETTGKCRYLSYELRLFQGFQHRWNKNCTYSEDFSSTRGNEWSLKSFLAKCFILKVDSSESQLGVKPWPMHELIISHKPSGFRVNEELMMLILFSTVC